MTERIIYSAAEGNAKAAPIPLFKVHMPESVKDSVNQVLYGGYIGQGPKVKEFEDLLGTKFDNPRILTVNSGTSALTLALRLSNVEKGDEVISTPMTCAATNVPIIAMGANIVWADINPNTGNIDPVDVGKKVTPKTKAIIAVHWGGYPCDLGKLNEIGQKHNIKIIEDAAHAFGSSYKGKPIGNHSDFTCFSFQAIKHLTTGDGGMLTCRVDSDYKRGKLLRWYGIDREAERVDFRVEQDIVEAGYKFHMNDINAAIGIEQLKYVDQVIKNHQENAQYYKERFKDLKKIKLLESKPDHKSSYWLFTMRVPDRSGFIQKLKEAGIVASQVHARNDTHTAFKQFRTNLPGVDEFSSEQVSIPVGWWLTKEELVYIADKVVEFCK